MNTTHEPMTTRQRAIVAILALLQFTILVDFMIVAPLGAVLLHELEIDTRQFGLVFSGAALAAGAASFAAAGFADRFDRKRLLLACYAGFLVGAAACGFATTYEFLLGARVVVGACGGVVASLTMAIVADVFPLAMRGRAVGALVTSVAAAQIAGLPAGLALANAWGWQAPFLVVAALGVLVGVAVAVALPAFGAAPTTENAFARVLRVATKPAHLRAFGTTLLLATGFTLQPLLTPYFVGDLRVDVEHLPLVFMITGVATFFVGPYAGRLADRAGKLGVFTGATVLAAVVFFVFASTSGPTPFVVVVGMAAALHSANTARMVAAGALVSAVPVAAERGAFMAINTSVQQAAGGLVALVGGWVVVVRADGGLARFDALCIGVAAAVLVAVVTMRRIARLVQASAAPPR